VKVPDGALFVGAVVLGAVVGFLVGAAEEGAVVGVVLAGVVAGAIGVVGCVIAGAVGDDDAFGVVFFAVLDGDALAEEDAAGELPFDEVIGGADTDSPVGVLVAATGVMPGTWVLNEKRAARPAIVPPRVRTARRIQPPGGSGSWGSGRCKRRLEVEGLVVNASPRDACGDQ
jgi:hypothetical protein